VVKFAPDGSRAVLADGLTGVEGVLILPDGRILASEYGLNRITQIATDGTVSSFVEGVSGPDHLAVRIVR